MMTAFRRGGAPDLVEVAAVQRRSPEAAQWNPADYLEHEFWVATVANRVAGFLVLRRLASDECEILNLAVAGEYRRKGLARGLLGAALADFYGDIFLEVRESNEAAQKFYKYLGFQQVSVRTLYYENPSESAIVMKFHSC